MNNSLVNNNLEINNNFSSKDLKILVCIHNKKRWKIVESIIISNLNSIKLRPCFLICLLIGQIGAEKFQNSLSKMIRLHRYIYLER